MCSVRDNTPKQNFLQEVYSNLKYNFLFNCVLWDNQLHTLFTRLTINTRYHTIQEYLLHQLDKNFLQAHNTVVL